MVLSRFAYLDSVTFGRLTMPSGVVLFTVERPWLNNTRSISCIPEGTYKLRPRPFFRGGYDAVEIVDVPGRTHILFHIANYASDVEGCIGVGSGINICGSMVTSSRRAFNFFMDEFNEKEFTQVEITHIEAALMDRDP